MNKLPSIRFDMLTYQTASVCDGLKTIDCRIIKPSVRAADIDGVISMVLPKRGGMVRRMAFVTGVHNWTDVLKNGPWSDSPYLKGRIYSVNGLRKFIYIDDVDVVQLQDLTEGEILQHGIRHTPYGCFVPGITVSSDNQSSITDPDYGCCSLFKTPKDAMAALVNKIYGAGTWEKDPWCWKYSFHLATLKEINHGN